MTTFRRQPQVTPKLSTIAAAKATPKNPQSYADSSAMLDHLLFGAALPPHLSRSPVGTVITRSPRMQESFAQQQAREAAARAKAAAEKMEKAPLIAVCYSHVCQCGASWQAFGFYGRKAKIEDYRAGQAFGTKRLDYKPINEEISEVVWQTVEEQTCINCFTDLTNIARIGTPDSSSLCSEKGA